MWSIYVPNLSKIGQSAAELLMISDRFFVCFRMCCNTEIGILKTRGPISAKCGENIARSSLQPKFKIGDIILLGVQTTASQSRALVSDKAKNCTL